MSVGVGSGQVRSGHIKQSGLSVIMGQRGATNGSSVNGERLKKERVESGGRVVRVLQFLSLFSPFISLLCRRLMAIIV